MINQIDELSKKGYFMVESKVRFVIFWQKEDSDREIKIIRPELSFEKMN